MCILMPYFKFFNFNINNFYNCVLIQEDQTMDESAQTFTLSKEPRLERIYNPIFEDIFVRYADLAEGQPFYHTHNVCEIYLLLKGEINYYINQKCFRLQAGTLLFIQPGEYHRCELVDPTVYERYVINISNKYLDLHSTVHTNLSDCFFNRPQGEPNITTLDERQIKDLLNLFESLLNLKTSKEYGQDILTISYLLQLLVKINLLFLNQKTMEIPDIMPPLVRETLEYIDEHLLEHITLQDLSAHLYHNSTYISRRFKKITGLSIQQYILRRKIYIAQSFLQEGKSVTESCALSGFSDYSNFSKVFKKVVGVSPKKYSLDYLQ